MTGLRDLAGVTAVILAGGLGTRLRSKVADRPKALAEVQGRPFLAYLLDQMIAAGIRRVVLCTGYMGEQIRTTFRNTYRSLALAYSHEPKALGTAGALRLAFPLFESDPVLAMNGDSFCQADLSEFWAWHRARGAIATLLLTKVPDTRRYGQVGVNEDGLVLGFDEKGKTHAPGWINAGVYLLSRRLLQRIPEETAVSLEREVFPAWIGRQLYAYRSKGRFLDIGTPEDYAQVEQLFASRHGGDSAPLAEALSHEHHDH